MANCGGICGIEISCSNGCGVLCTVECDDCTQWCEPATVENPSGPLNDDVTIVRVNRNTGGVRVEVGKPTELPVPDLPRYSSDQEELRVAFNDLPRSSVARLLGHHLGRAVRVVAETTEDERISDSDEGTVAELVAKYSLVLE
jgi:hypothetical protein